MSEVFAMAGGETHFPYTQTRHGNSRSLPLGALRGRAPQKGSDETLGSNVGEGVPPASRISYGPVTRGNIWMSSI